MKKNNKWFSLPLAMWLVIIISLLAYSILEYIIPFSRDMKWVENSSVAYYHANSWIEEWLYHISIRTDEKLEESKNYTNNNVGDKYNTFSSWTLLPPIWEWNSEYDKDWNVISSWNPIQLSIWNWYITWTDDIAIKFRIPDFNWDWDNNDLTLNWSSFPPYLPIVNWQLSASNNTLNASWSIIRANNIDWTELIINNFQWVDLNWSETNNEIFSTFYSNNCNSWNDCTLKFSVVNKLETDDIDPIIIPYLEWQLTTWDNIIPLRYSKIESSWKSYWYKKDLEVKVPSQTVNEAFDFTVFQ